MLPPAGAGLRKSVSCDVKPESCEETLERRVPAPPPEPPTPPGCRTTPRRQSRGASQDERPPRWGLRPQAKLRCGKLHNARFPVFMFCPRSDDDLQSGQFIWSQKWVVSKSECRRSVSVLQVQSNFTVLSSKFWTFERDFGSFFRTGSTMTKSGKSSTREETSPVC